MNMFVLLLLLIEECEYLYEAFWLKENRGFNKKFNKKFNRNS
jgi:hypothetical protein